MVKRKLLYGYAFSLAFVALSLSAEGETPEPDRWQAPREEIFRLVGEGALGEAEKHADALVALTRKEGTNADQVDALSIRGRVAATAEARRGYYEEALKLSRANVFASNHRNYVSLLSLSHVQQDLGDVAMETGNKAEALRYYNDALGSLSAFDLQTYLSYAVSPDARYSPSANELRYIVGWLNLREGNMEAAEDSFRFAEKGMRAAGRPIDDGVKIGLAVTARYRGDKGAAEAQLRDVEKRGQGKRGLASAEDRGVSPAASAMIKRARAYLETGNISDLRW